MGSLHKNLVGDNLHIAKIDVSTGTPTGSVVAAVIGQMYWDSVANKMYVAEQATNSDWVHSGIANDTLLELSDVDISTYVGKAGLHLKVKSDETGITVGDQSLDIADSPTFAALTVDQLGSSGVIQIFKNAGNSTVGYQFQDSVGAVVLSVDTLNGRVGVGAIAPTAKFEVSSTGTQLNLNHTTGGGLHLLL